MRKTKDRAIQDCTRLRAEGYGPNQAMQLVGMVFLAPKGLGMPAVTPKGDVCLTNDMAQKWVRPVDPTRHANEIGGLHERRNGIRPRSESTTRTALQGKGRTHSHSGASVGRDASPVKVRVRPGLKPRGAEVHKGQRTQVRCGLGGDLPDTAGRRCAGLRRVLDRQRAGIIERAGGEERLRARRLVRPAEAAH